MPYRHEISDHDWARIKDMLSPENIGEGRHSKPNRDMLNGMLWISKAGSAWPDLPERFGRKIASPSWTPLVEKELSVQAA